MGVPSAHRCLTLTPLPQLPPPPHTHKHARMQIPLPPECCRLGPAPASLCDISSRYCLPSLAVGAASAGRWENSRSWSLMPGKKGGSGGRGRWGGGGWGRGEGAAPGGQAVGGRGKSGPLVPEGGGGRGRQGGQAGVETLGRVRGWGRGCGWGAHIRLSIACLASHASQLPSPPLPPSVRASTPVPPSSPLDPFLPPPSPILLPTHPLPAHPHLQSPPAAPKSASAPAARAWPGAGARAGRPAAAAWRWSAGPRPSPQTGRAGLSG